MRIACSALNGASLSPPPKTREVGVERMKSQRLGGVLRNTIFWIWYGHCNYVLTCTISTQNQAYQVPLVDGGGAHKVPLQSGCQGWGTSFSQYCKPLLRSTQISLNSPTLPHSSSSIYVVIEVSMKAGGELVGWKRWMNTRRRTRKE